MNSCNSLMTASAATRARAKDQAALQKLVVELRSIVLSASNPPPRLPPPAPSDERPPCKTKRRLDAKAEAAKPPTLAQEIPPLETLSKEGSEVAGKKKKKKKKRSVLANQGNPHHVNNCTFNGFPR